MIFLSKGASNNAEMLKMKMMVASMGESPEKSTERVWKENGFFFEIRQLILPSKKQVFLKTRCYTLIMVVLLRLRVDMQYILSM